jgi:adenine phosphoribosyltransferase
VARQFLTSLRSVPVLGNPSQHFVNLSIINLGKGITMQKLLSIPFRTIPDFPKPGIMFKDISPLLEKPAEFKQLISSLAESWEGKVDKIGSFDARGFLFASALAYEMELPFFMLRKKGKLPGACIEASYDLEYGSASLEIQSDAVKEGERVLLIDDLLATGGTACAGCTLIEKLKGEVVGIQFVIELGDLRGRSALSKYNVQSVITI